MFELSHEANVAFQLCTEHIDALQALTLKSAPKSLDDARQFTDSIRNHVVVLVGAFELFVAGACAELRKKGVFPTVMPSNRRQTMTFLEREAAQSSLGPTMTPVGAPSPPVSPANLSQKKVSIDERSMDLAESKTSKGLQVPAPPAAAQHSEDGATAAAGLLSSQPQASFIPTTGSHIHNSGKGPSVSAGCCNSTGETIESIIATGLYVHFEALVRQVLAKEAAVFVYQPKPGGAEEAQAVAIFGGKPRPPHNVRVPLKTGVVGAVIRSGMAVNVTPDTVTETNHYSLCFPIFPIQGRLVPVGAVLLEKKATNTPFTKEDEEVTYNWCKLASHILHECQVNLTNVYFDPNRTLAKKLKPLQSIEKRGATLAMPKWMESAIAGRQTTFAAGNATNPSSGSGSPRKANTQSKSTKNDGTDQINSIMNKIEETMNAATQPMGNYSPKLASMVSAFSTPQLLFHTVHHNHFTTLRGANIGGSGIALQTQNLMDVADYVSSLEDCWKRAADDLQAMEIEHVSRMDDFRERKKRLKSTQVRMHQLETVCEYYKGKYESIKRELTVLCGAPVEDETERPPALVGSTSAGVGGLGLSTFGSSSPGGGVGGGGAGVGGTPGMGSTKSKAHLQLPPLPPSMNSPKGSEGGLQQSQSARLPSKSIVQH